MDLKETLESVRSNVFVEVKVVTNGTLQVNDNWEVVKKLIEMGFESDGITQDDGEVAWTILTLNKGFLMVDETKEEE